MMKYFQPVAVATTDEVVDVVEAFELVVALVEVASVVEVPFTELLVPARH